MKRFLVFIVVAIVTVSLGFTVFAFVKNNEQITLLQANHYINSGEEFEIQFDVVNKKRQTDYTYSLENAEGIQQTSADNVFKGVSGGEYSIKVETTNKNYPSFTISVVVGDGSKEFPYFIKDEESLMQLGSEKYPLTANYKLAKDVLDLSEENFTGFGALQGNFDGNNCKIINASYSATENQNSMALFSEISANAVVEDLTIENFNFSGSFTSVAVVTAKNNGIIRNVNVVNSEITNTNTSGKSAGIAVVNQTTGTSQARIDRVASDVKINARNAVAGLCVYNQGAIVINSYSKGNLTATSTSTHLSGLITYNQAYNNLVCYVKNCYSISQLSTNAIGKASLIYSNTDAYSEVNIIMGCYYVETLTQCNIGVKDVESQNNNYNAITEEDLKDFSKLISYTSSTQQVLWNNVLWIIDNSNNGYPHLDFLAPAVADDFRTSASASDISTLDSLINVFRNPTTSSDRFVITQDIDCSSLTEFAPLGVSSSSTVEFNGTLEAGYNQEEERYYTIKNVTINSAYPNAALIAVTGASAQILNITVENIKVSSGTNVAGLVGTNNGLIDNCQIVSTENAVLGSQTVTSNLGGICGMNNGTVSNCKSSIKIAPNTNTTKINVGGIAGTNNGFIYNCECDSEIASTGTDEINLGGIAGTSIANINKCLFSGSIVSDMYSTTYVGGISAYSSNRAKFVRCRNTGNLEGNYVGGIVCFSQKSEVSECTVEGSLSGDKVGGIAYRTPEIILNNVSVICEMFGRDENSIKAGIATELVNNSESSCGPIFLSATFDDVGNNFVTSYYCTNTAWPWEWNPSAIAVRYCVFDKDIMSNAKRWVLFDIALLEKLPVNDDGGCSMDVCMSIESSTVFSDNGFSSDVWAFNQYEYPTLKNCK